MTDERSPLPRVETGVPGLDEILKGGLMKGGVYLAIGTPGSGKTILGNQICFNHAAKGGRALYLTVLAESHGRMLSSIGGMAFFDEQRLANEVAYLSGYQALETEGLPGLLTLIRRSVQKQRATMLVIDGLVTATGAAESDLAVRKFIHELQVVAELVGCTVMLLTGSPNTDANYPERTMVDGLFIINRRRVGIRTVRELEVTKFRGSNNLSGAHFFEISDAGVTIFPRIEALWSEPTEPHKNLTRKPFGNRALDEMLNGGPLSGSTTLLVGAPGSGKTILGTQFLAAGIAQGEVGLHLGFFEVPERLRHRMKEIGIDTEPWEKKSMLKVMWRPLLERLSDALAQELITEVTRLKVKRLFIDGWAGFSKSLIYPERAGAFLFALTSALRALGVTTLISDETAQRRPDEITLPESGVSEVVENIFLLRYQEKTSKLSRVLSVVKMREGSHDKSLREFQISNGGLNLVGAAPKKKATRAKRGR